MLTRDQIVIQMLTKVLFNHFGFQSSKYIISSLDSFNLVKYHENDIFHKASLSCAMVNLSFAPKSSLLHT